MHVNMAKFGLKTDFIVTYLMVRKQRIPGPEYGVVSITQELVRNAGLRSHPRPTETESHLQVIRGVAVSRLLYLVLTLASYIDCWALIFLQLEEPSHL